MSELVRVESNAPIGVFSGAASFELAQRMAKALASSDLVPTAYQGNVSNTLLALEVSQRIGASPLMVMQNLHVIEGRPSWSSQFVIAALNSCGRFTPLRFRIEDRGEQTVSYERWTGPKGNRTKSVESIQVRDRSCVAIATDKATGEIIEGPEVSIAIAVAEGWYTKAGSKWQTMPDLMLRYRAAKWFGNLYAPDVLMGLASADEVDDIERVEVATVTPAGAAPVAVSRPSIADLNAEILDAAPEPIAAPESVAAPEPVVQPGPVVVVPEGEDCDPF